MKTSRPTHAIRLVFGLSALVVVALATGCNIRRDFIVSGYSDADLKASARRAKNGAIPSDLKFLEIENRFGAVTVRGAASGQTEWSWKLAVRARTDELANQLADEADIVAEQDGDRLRLTVTLPESRIHKSLQSDLEIRVPEAASIRAKNQFGKITVTDLAGAAEVDAGHSPVEIRNIKGKVQAETSFASMHVHNVGPAVLKNQNGSIEADRVEGALEAKTSFATLMAHGIAGQVTARNQNGKVEVIETSGDVDLRTSFAGLQVEAVHGSAKLVNQNGGVTARKVTGSVDADTSFATLDVECGGQNLIVRNQNGAVRLRPTSLSLGRVDAETSFNSIDLRLPAGLKPAIRARTSFAEVESDFPVLMPPRGGDPFADVASRTPRISLQNQNGPIRIRRDAAAGG